MLMFLNPEAKGRAEGVPYPGTFLVDSEGVVSSESYRIPTHYTHEQLASMIDSWPLPDVRYRTRVVGS